MTIRVGHPVFHLQGVTGAFTAAKAGDPAFGLIFTGHH